MEWKQAMEKERAAMKRIVALLFALADLAELACTRSRAVRGLVLWVLRHAEPVARDFVCGPDASPMPAQAGPAGDSTAEAMRLAASFRDLACRLDSQVELALAAWDEARGRTCRPPFDMRRSRAAAASLGVALDVALSAPIALMRSPIPDTS